MPINSRTKLPDGGGIVIAAINANIDGNSSAVDGIVAHAGGGQALATPLTAYVNRVSVVATGGDSVKLPPAVAGFTIIVVNADGASMNLFPAPGDQINTLGVNAAFPMVAGKVAFLIAAGSGQWHSILTA